MFSDQSEESIEIFRQKAERNYYYCRDLKNPGLIDTINPISKYTHLLISKTCLMRFFNLYERPDSKINKAKFSPPILK